MNTLKTKFWGIRFLRIVLKSQHCLIGVVLQNRQEIGLLIPKQGGTWAMLNETCCFWVNTSSQVKSHSPQEKHSDPTGSQRMSWRVLRVATISLWGILLAMGNLELANAPTAYDCSMCYQLSNLFCLWPGQQATACNASSTRLYKTTADHGKYHSPLDGCHHKDSEAWD